MDNRQINDALLHGRLDLGVLPNVDNLQQQPFVFKSEFGLDELPSAPGVILIRGPRQYGKSTWLERQIMITIKKYGAGSALYLNGDEVVDSKELMKLIREITMLFPANNKIKRLFIDEITAIKDWQKAIKRLVDANELNNILLVTTGSKATDLRRGIERLPGRKGKLERTNYIFTPISYAEFKSKCVDVFKDDLLYAYLLSGGSPVAINALATHGRLPEYVLATVSDWIGGEFAASGRSGAYLLAVLQSIYRRALSPIGQAKLARESGLANNTVAKGYIELFSDLMVVVPCFAYDATKQITLFRKPCKYHFINLLAAMCWHPHKPRTVREVKALNCQGVLFEWLIAQEIWRRNCIKYSDLPDYMNFWQSKKQEIDFVLPKDKLYIEVKSGKTSLMNFTWFAQSFSKDQLYVVSQDRFCGNRVQGITIEDFLLAEVS